MQTNTLSAFLTAPKLTLPGLITHSSENASVRFLFVLNFITKMEENIVHQPTLYTVAISAKVIPSTGSKHKQHLNKSLANTNGIATSKNVSVSTHSIY